jgi:peroxin-19
LDAVLDDDFAKQLAAGMEELMSGEDQDEFKETFEKIWKSFESTSLDDSVAQSSKAPTAATAVADPENKKSFQDTIAQTMNKLRDSSDKVEVKDCNEAGNIALLDLSLTSCVLCFETVYLDGSLRRIG